MRLKQSFLFFLAAAGLIWSIIFSFATGSDRANPHNKLAEQVTSPFEHNIFGIGIIESSSRNINIGSFASGVVTKVMVTEGDVIEQGDVLFMIDTRSAIAKLRNKQDALKVAQSALALSNIELDERQDRLNRAEGLQPGRSISLEELQSKKFAALKAEADIKIKQDLIQQAKSSIELVSVELDKMTIRSPISGLVLKVRVTPGEFISGNEQDDQSPVLLGKIHPLYLRVQIDEHDIHRFDKSLLAYAYPRGNSGVKLSLEFVRIEPYAKPKTNIQGGSARLIDTRVIEIIYKINSDMDNLYIGRQLDVFLESKAL